MFALAMRRFAILGVLAGLLVFVEACEFLKCGPGTREQNGRCVVINHIPNGDGGPHCGYNTVLYGNECVPVEKLCGEFTRVEHELDDAGQPTGAFICIGDPPTGQAKPPPCPEEFGPEDEICINGYAHWVFDDQGGEAPFMEQRIADPTADATTIVVEVYDPLAYASDRTTPPLGVGEIDPVEGTFRVLNIAVPSQGIVAMVVEDIDNDASDLFAMTGVPFPAVPRENLEEVVAFGVTHDQVTRWSEQIGQPALEATGCPEPPGGGPRTILTCGTWISRYVVLEGQSIAGILGSPEGTVPEDPVGDVPPEKTFYPGINADGELVFDDPTECVVWSDDQGPHEHTGILGSVFGVYVPLQNVSGHCAADTQCSEAACLWIQVLGGSITDALFVQLMPQVLCSDWPPEDTQCATGM